MLADGWKPCHDCDLRCPPGQCVPASYFVASRTRLIPWFTFSAGHGGRCAGELWRIAFAKINSHAFKSFNALLMTLSRSFLPTAGQSAGDWKHGKPQSARIVENAFDFF